MPLRTVVVIVLRLYAVTYFLDGLSSAMLMLQNSLLVQSMTSQLHSAAVQGQNPYTLIIGSLGMLFLAPLIWLLASWLSRQVARGHETDVSLGTLTLEDFCRLAFIFLGLKFMLSSFGMSLQNGCDFFTRDFPLKNGDILKWHYLWPFLGHVATFSAGFICLLGANKWTRLLLRRYEKLQ